jgi:endonuclease YncB( thermonuclease family)
VAVVVDRVIDGDTIVLRNGAHVRLLQIDAPESHFGHECYSDRATWALRKLLPPGTRVVLRTDPTLDTVDRYGRLLRYVLRDGVNVNVELVRRGAAAPYFYRGERGRYASLLQELALRARGAGIGLWGKCPGTGVDFYRGIDTSTS